MYEWKSLFEHRDANGNKKKKCILLEDEESDWLQIWMASSSLDIKHNKAIKMSFHAKMSVLSNTVTLLAMSSEPYMTIPRVFKGHEWEPHLGSDHSATGNCVSEAIKAVAGFYLHF